MADKDIPDAWLFRILDLVAFRSRPSLGQVLREVHWPQAEQQPVQDDTARTREHDKPYKRSQYAIETGSQQSHILRIRSLMSDSDVFQNQAKQVAVDNFNLHRNPDKSPELTIDDVFVVWFAKTLANWKAIVSSTLAKGLLWEITFNGNKNEIYLDVYSKLKNVKIELGEKKS